MEMTVRAVAGLNHCYVSLPISLLQTLESTHPSHHLPAFLPLQLLSLSSADVICHVAWSGSPSSSSAIEVAQEFAACIGLSDGTVVRVRAIPNVPKASLVTIEPLTVDDWEVVELNAEIAEAAILNQVRLVYGKMSFPLWLHGNRIVTFTVVSMVPDKTVVQLVPGTEIAVAPKRRRKSTDEFKNSNSKPIDETYCSKKVLLRVQDPQLGLIDKCDISGGTVGIELSSIALIHPDTARKYSFDSLQVVVIAPRSPLKLKNESTEISPLGKQLSSAKDLNGKVLNSEDKPYAVVRLVVSDSAAEGHLMLCQSLRRYLRVSFHSWLYVQTYVEKAESMKKIVSSYSLSPCQFVPLQKSKDPGRISADLPVDNTNFDNIIPNRQLNCDMGEPYLSLQQDLVSALSNEPNDTAGEESGILSDAKNRLKCLFHAWMMAQFRAVSSITSVKPATLVLGPTTFLSFKLMVSGSLSSGKLTKATSDSFGDAKVTVESVKEMLFVVSAFGESFSDKKYTAFELALGGDQSAQVDDYLKYIFENLSLGTFVSYDT